MKQDDFLKQVSSKLDGLAQHHQEKPIVIENVLSKIEHKKSSRFGFLRLSSYALAAAITGFVVIPNATEYMRQTDNQVVTNPKLSPQMVEDLEMVLVLGEEEVPHGS